MKKAQPPQALPMPVPATTDVDEVDAVSVDALVKGMEDALLKAKAKEAFFDGLVNSVTGLGDLSKDKRTAGRYVLDAQSFDALECLYRASDLCALVVDKPVEEMTREGWCVSVPDDEEKAEELEAMLEDLETEAAFETALRYERLFGGAVILVGVNDGVADLAVPLDEKKVRAVDYLTVFDPCEARITEWEDNPAKKGFGKPKFFSVQPHSMGLQALQLNKVHASRMLVFPGVVASRKQLRSSAAGVHQGWGDSALVPVLEKIRDYDQSWGGVAHILTDFAQAVLKMKNLNAALLGDKNNLLLKRFQMMARARSLVNLTMLGEGEEFERKGTSMTGVPETLKEMMTRISAAARIPVPVLFGTSSTGLNSSGEGEARVWYDQVKAMQRKKMKPGLVKLLKLCMASGGEPENWQVKFNPLWQLSDTEKADVRLKLAQVDQIYVGLGVASTEDIVDSRFQGDELGMDLQVDQDALEERAEQEAEARDVQHEVTVTNLKEHGQETPPKPVAKPPTK